MYKSYVIANIAKTHPYFNKLDEFAFECKNVYNSTLYQYRQNYFNNLELISGILFDGKPLKKINHRFNKQLAKLQSKRDDKKNKLSQVENQIDHMMADVIFFYELNSKHNFNEQKYKKLLRKQTHLTNEISKLNLRISRLYEKRSNRIQYCLHKLSRELVELTVSNRISKIVIGYNEQWKQAINLGHVNNQNFVQIPFKTLIRYIQYKSDVEVVLQEESYTSKCSFLDNEDVCKHAEYLGKRVKRGLFRSHMGHEIHADINAAYNIAKKAGYDFGSYLISPCSWAVVKRIRFN